MSAVRRVGNFLQVQDGDGCRHLLRVTSVQALSDTDLMRKRDLHHRGGSDHPGDAAARRDRGLVAPGERAGKGSQEEPWPF